MPTFSMSTLLHVWDRRREEPPARWALILLGAYAELPIEDLAELSAGERDRALWRVRRALFGSRLPGRADCPACGEMLELNLDLDSFEREAVSAEEALVRRGDFSIEWRLPTAGDLAEICRMDRATARRRLIRRCLPFAFRNEEAISPDECPPELLSIVEEAMARADPSADVRIALDCPICRHSWSIWFDIVAFLAVEIDHLARQALNEVHQLASAYGWREADIIAMSAVRRAAYVQMCNR